MSNNLKTNALDKWDRDGVAQHRNIMQELAMKKQITMYKREEKILERELREISKVKETLLQIRTPLRRRVEEAELEDTLDQSSRGTERTVRKTPSVKTRSRNLTRPPSVWYGDNAKFEVMDTESKSGLYSKTSKEGENCAKALNIPHRHACTLEIVGQKNIPALAYSRDTQTLAQRNGSASVLSRSKRPASEGSGKCERLPALNTLNPPSNCSPSVRRKSRMNKPFSATRLDHQSDHYLPRSSTLFTPNNTDTRHLLRSKSVPCGQSSHSAECQPSRARQSRTETDEATTLTMEETLRIKGKFRQIGHSVIATALLKGLRQKKQLSSEAIHNMHKPISLGEERETTKSDQNNNVNEEEASLKEPEEELHVTNQTSNKKSFRSIARKAINVNRFLTVTKERRLSKSDPEGVFAMSAVTTRPNPLANTSENTLDKVTGQEASIHSAQRKKSWTSNGTERPQRRNSATEFQQDTNKTQEFADSKNALHSQLIFRKQSKDVDPYRPLMNPRTAHVRRRRNTFSGDL
ncbi:uncharacterized protein [Montipora capricornis]|uniref:uncharacterized protein n=1 Tax=Montipora capricornis TaxID=246305 RepID=UPI0035F15187